MLTRSTARELFHRLFRMSTRLKQSQHYTQVVTKEGVLTVMRSSFQMTVFGDRPGGVKVVHLLTYATLIHNKIGG
jgi:hypothetical protein